MDPPPGPSVASDGMSADPLVHAFHVIPGLMPMLTVLSHIVIPDAAGDPGSRDESGAGSPLPWGEVGPSGPGEGIRPLRMNL
jgi:hypothetical protein